MNNMTMICRMKILGLEAMSTMQPWKKGVLLTLRKEREALLPR